jgi:hypothetical protein
MSNTVLWAIDRIVSWVDPSWWLRFCVARLLREWGYL